MSNIIRHGSESRAKLFEGIELVFKTVAPTLGANGRNVVYNKFSRVPIISNDGVKAAREVDPPDLGALQGANLIKQVSEQTNDEVGDGTTTSIVLAYSIIKNGMELLNDSSRKVNPMKLRREITAATEKVLQALKDSAQEVTTLEQLTDVATISVEDPEIGKTIAQAIFDAGKNGIVYVNESEKVGVSVEKIEGYQFHQGMITPYLITDPAKMETILYNPSIIMTELQTLLNDDFKNLIGQITQKNKEILLICDEIHDDVIKYAFLNLFKKGPDGQFLPPNFKMAIVKKPLQANSLEDIAALTGGEAMTKDKGKIKYNISYLGTAGKVVINQKTTTIFDGAGINKMFTANGVVSTLDTHINNLKSQIEESKDENEKIKLQERIAILTGGIYLLNVGHNTEAEARYLKDKVDDAVAATKAAQEEGIVAGGGMSLYNVAIDLVDNLSSTDGGKIILQSIVSPLEQIISNSGESYTDIISKITTTTEGFNALTLEIEPHMIKAGIIDPLKVTRLALSNASSFAGLILTTEVLITNLPSDSKSDIV